MLILPSKSFVWGALSLRGAALSDVAITVNLNHRPESANNIWRFNPSTAMLTPPSNKVSSLSEY
jgi:hypothetical protein